MKNTLPWREEQRKEGREGSRRDRERWNESVT